MVDYDKRFPVPSETKSEYKFKNGRTIIIKKTFTDYLHPRTGTIMRRDLLKVVIEGCSDEKTTDELMSWIKNGYKTKIPKCIRTYMEELK